MKKIVSGVLGLLLIVSTFSVAAVANLSSTAAVDNVAFTSGDANLLFSSDGVGWSTTYTFPKNLWDNVYPGYLGSETFWVKNASEAPISLALSSKLVSAEGDWDELAGQVAMIFTLPNGSHASIMTYLTDWNTAVIPWDISLGPNEAKEIVLYMRVAETADNSIAHKFLRTNWEIYGNQLMPQVTN